MSDEQRITDPQTGGAKGQKLARFDLLPPGPLWELAEHFGRGAAKYADRNWERGYAWSLNFGAAMRHLWKFWGGEDLDPETGTRHVISAAWHCLALAEFATTHPDKDDRPRREVSPYRPAWQEPVSTDSDCPWCVAGLPYDVVLSDCHVQRFSDGSGYQLRHCVRKETP